jgi:UDP-2-acetamido-3-amino-2,3-dideoxy-glucuronate N-acetyltransferase
METFNRIASDVSLGRAVKIFGLANLYGCTVGDESRIGCFVEIQRNATVGAPCKISSHAFICEGVTIEDDVFMGHHVGFMNDLFPRACRPDGTLQTDVDWKVVPILVKRRATIGSGAVILGGVTIGAEAIVGGRGGCNQERGPAHHCCGESRPPPAHSKGRGGAMTAGESLKRRDRFTERRTLAERDLLVARTRQFGRSKEPRHASL